MALEYVLITPARNEAAFIEKTLQSVVAQTVLPKRWVIVSDGSTDGTDEIVHKYQEGREWLELVRLPERQECNFAAKVQAFNAVDSTHLVLIEGAAAPIWWNRYGRWWSSRWRRRWRRSWVGRTWETRVWVVLQIVVDHHAAIGKVLL